MARVLIVDDIGMVRTTLRLILESGQHEIVAEAEDGTLAVELCAKFDPDVVIMDIQMPLHGSWRPSPSWETEQRLAAERISTEIKRHQAIDFAMGKRRINTEWRFPHVWGID